MEPAEFTTATSDAQLEQVLALQRRNLEQSVDEQEAADQGFVTVRHDLELLRDMNRAEPHIIAVCDGQVVGYALVMLKRFQQRIPILKPMFARLAGLQHRGRPIDDYRFFIMGQVCVDRSFRGSGVFDGLYRTMKKRYAESYDLVVTEVACRNTRSCAAHTRVGFRLLHRYRDDRGEEWDLIVWDWATPDSADS
jgi:GNAT superfamily N-acetyltransferase